MTLQSLRRKAEDNDRKMKRARDYFRCKQTPENTSPLIPPGFEMCWTAMPFVRLAAQAIDDRIQLDSLDAASEETQTSLRERIKANGGDNLFSGVHMLGFEFGRAYVIPVRAPGGLRYSVVSAENMVHEIDPATGKISEALRVYGDTRQNFVHYQPGRWDYHEGGKLVKTDIVPSGEIGVFCFLNREEPNDVFGRPEGKPAWKLQDSAVRIMTNLNVASELLAVPQRGILGASAEDFGEAPEDGAEGPYGAPPDPAQLYTSSFLMLNDSSAKFAEFSAAQLQNFTTGLNSVTRNSASVLGVPVSTFGIASDANPASGDSIDADDKRLIRRAERLTRGFEVTWLDLFRYTARVLGQPEDGIRLNWVDPSLPNLASRADAIAKLAGVKTDSNSLYSRRELLRRAGEPTEVIDAMEDERETSALGQLLALGADDTGGETA